MIDQSTPVDASAGAELAVAKPRVKSWRARIGLMALATALTVVAADAVLTHFPRALMPAKLQTIQTFYTRRLEWRELTTGDRYLGFKMRPDVDLRFPFEGGAIPIRTTSYGVGPIGFRDIGTAPPFGAIVVGDSFTFCDEVLTEACWVRRLSDATGVSMATRGVSGYSTMAEARVLERYGSAFGAPLVLVGVFPNDFADNVNFDKWTRSGTSDQVEWMERAHERHPGALWLEQRSTLYRLLVTGLRAPGPGFKQYREGDVDLVLRFHDWWVRTVKAPERHPGWALMQKSLLDMKRTTAEMRARLVVLYFPTKEEAYWDIARKHFPGSAGTVDIDAVPRLLTGFLSEHGILGCDVSGDVRAEARRGRQLYHRVSGHFNDEGNRVAATSVGRCLAELRVLDRS